MQIWQSSMASHTVTFCFPQPNTWDRLLKTMWPAAITFRATFLDEGEATPL